MAKVYTSSSLDYATGMKLPDVLNDAEALAHTWNDQITLERHVYVAHFNALRQAYASAGLVLLGDSGLVPGFDEEGTHLQVQLFPLANGEMFGSRYVMFTSDESLIDEVDVLMFNHRFDTTSGRLQTAGTERIIDYTVTPTRIKQVTSLVLDICQQHDFIAEEPLTLLELPK